MSIGPPTPTLTNIFLYISLIGYVIIIITFLLFYKKQNLRRKQLFSLSVYDLLNVIIMLIPTKEGTKLCHGQALLTILFSVMAPFWAMMIAITIYLALIKDKQNMFLERLFKWSHLINWIVSILFVIPPAIASPKVKQYMDYCYYDGWYMLSLYIWYWIAILICLVLVVISLLQITKSIRQLKQLNPDFKTKTKKQIYQNFRMLAIPCVFIWCYLWPSLHRILQFFQDKIPLWIRYMHVVNFTLDGIAYCLIFIVFDKSVRVQYKNLFRRRSSKNQKLNVNLIKKKDAENSSSSYMDTSETTDDTSGGFMED
ncbi:g protein-coupled receptor [Anaeramoeba flamelloides]|uniref:G protein-coupled receptor n=1 Tax=Anaeramoeba flamelloides TaxID=1746091 RepID=A0AAV7ZF37_9EUKA|nr:g protein-coupled receptor [Anaeramoeba flamelloides]KAJ6236266.1 g protein-coupled receptor [Anaeramoeba flamelloides]